MPFGDGDFSVSGSHQYNSEGNFEISVEISTARGVRTTCSHLARVRYSGIWPEVEFRNWVWRSTQPTTIRIGEFIDVNSTDATAYSITIDWGDGSTSAGRVVRNGKGNWSVLGEHTYAECGDYAIGFVVSKQVNGESPRNVAAEHGTISVYLCPSVFISEEEWNSWHIIGPDAISGAILSRFTGSNPDNQYTAVIDWGDGATSAGEIRANEDGTFDVVGSHQYAEQGSYDVNIRITASDGYAITDTRRAVISAAELVPLNDEDAFWSPVSVDTLVLLNEFDDQHPEPGSLYSATIDWGDGTISTGSWRGDAANKFAICGQHSYGKLGEYRVTCEIHKVGPSGDRSSSSVTRLIATVYDGSAWCEKPIPVTRAMLFEMSWWALAPLERIILVQPSSGSTKQSDSDQQPTQPESLERKVSGFLSPCGGVFEEASAMSQDVMIDELL